MEAREYNWPMQRDKAKKLGAGATYLAALLGLGAVGFAFLPLLRVNTVEGSRLYFTSWKLFFGGEDLFDVSGTTYGFNYSINIYLLIMLQLFVLGALSTGLGRRSIRNLIFGLILYSGGFIFGCLVPLFVHLTNPGIDLHGLGLSYGFFLMAGSLLLAIALTISSLVISLRYRSYLNNER